MSSIALRVAVGPLAFQFWPDGDDPGIGMLEVLYERDVVSQTSIDAVTRADWDRFVRRLIDGPAKVEAPGF